MFDYCPFVCPICGEEMDGLRPYRNPSTNDELIVIDCEHCETQYQFTDSWEEVLSKLKYAYLPAPDDVMETAFARLADELEAQAAAELEKRETLLFHMLSHTAHFLERFLKRQEARDTPQSLEAAEYIRGELETAQTWLQEVKANK